MTEFLECFPYVCPEPVLAKRLFLDINGIAKEMGFLTGSIYTEGLVPDAAVPAVQRDQGLQKTKSAHLFVSQLSLDCVCPEPVLVN